MEVGEEAVEPNPSRSSAAKDRERWMGEGPELQGDKRQGPVLIAEGEGEAGDSGGRGSNLWSCNTVAT